MGMRTILLKLYRPSKAKQRIMDDAVMNYNRAYEFLLEKAYHELDAIRSEYKSPQGNYSANILSKWVDSETGARLNTFQVQPFKDALKLELGMNLVSYLTLKDRNIKTSFAERTDYDLIAIDERCGTEKDANDKNIRKQGMGDKNIKLRPIYFCRYDTKRSYCLLHDKSKDRYYAKLYLMNRRNARPADAHAPGTKPLRYLHQGFEPLAADLKIETFILVPLSFGKYQEKYLKTALSDPSILRTAKLYKKDTGYYLAVSIDTGEPEAVLPDTYLGIARGRKSELNYTVTGMQGNIIAAGAINIRKGENRLPRAASSGRNRRSPSPEENHRNSKESISLTELHKASKEILCIAFLYKAQVIVQNLADKSDHLSQPLYPCRTYMELIKLLDYKLKDTGLPAPIKVSSVDIYYRCPECSNYTRKNHFKDGIFICTRCGAAYDTEQVGSLNLARKLLKYRKDKIKIHVIREQDSSIFVNRLLGLRCRIPHGENQLLLLREEIYRIEKQITDNCKENYRENNKSAGTKLSILKKIGRSGALYDHIEFISLRK